MNRYLQSTSATLRVTFSVAGVPTNPSPDSATVRVVRMDGTELQATTSAVDAGTGVFTYTLTPAAQTASLDRLTAYWTATLSGASQTVKTYSEIVGGFYFTIEEFQTRYGADVASYSAEDIAAWRTTAEQAIERAVGFSFVPRYASETVNGYGEPLLQVARPYVRTIRAATVDGTAITLADAKVAGVTSVYYPGWTRGYSNVVVRYEHGLDAPPGEVKEAAMILTKDWLINGPVTERATQMTDGAGGIVNLATPGFRGQEFGIPFVDQVVNSHRLPVFA